MENGVKDGSWNKMQKTRPDAFKNGKESGFFAKLIKTAIKKNGSKLASKAELKLLVSLYRERQQAKNFNWNCRGQSCQGRSCKVEKGL